MIISCPRCGRRYRINDQALRQSPARFRCTGCGHIFQHSEPPSAPLRKEDQLPSIDIPLGHEEDFKSIARLLDDIEDGGKLSEKSAEESRGPREPEAEDPPPPGKTKLKEPSNGRTDSSELREGRQLSSGWLLFLVFCLVITIAALVIWQSSPVRSALNTGVTRALSTIEAWIVSHNDRDLLREARQGIELAEVEESVHDNWIAGKILLLGGIAINNSDFTLSSIRVKGKLMDSDRNVVAEAESYCGNILTEEELRNLTRREIERELLMPAGRDRRGFSIPPGGPVPFMITFINPPAEAGLFAVELVDVTLASE